MKRLSDRERRKCAAYIESLIHHAELSVEVKHDNGVVEGVRSDVWTVEMCGDGTMSICVASSDLDAIFFGLHADAVIEADAESETRINP